jgi:hypothetical protein
VKQLRERIAQHGGAGGRQKTHTTADTFVAIALQDIYRFEVVVLISFNAIDDRHIPTEPAAEDARSKPEHLVQVFAKICVGRIDDELQHDDLRASVPRHEGENMRRDHPVDWNMRPVVIVWNPN